MTGWPLTEGFSYLPDIMSDGSPWPRISIVTPSFNQGDFIEETIKSVLLQGYPNLEYIIIDGGSTDRSVGIIKEYEPLLTYWISEPDSGQSDAINKGWSRASGEILYWLNSDDLLMPGALQRVAFAFRSRPELGLAHGMTRIVDRQGYPTGEILGSDCDLHSLLLGSRNVIAQPSAFISRDALESVGLLNIEFQMSMDWDLWIRIASMYPITFLPEIWSCMRVWEGTKTRNISACSGREHLESVRQLLFNNDISGLNAEKRRHALAAAYGRASWGEFQLGHHAASRKYLLQSILRKPLLMGGDARKWAYHILMGPRLVKTCSRIKKLINKRLGLIVLE